MVIIAKNITIYDVLIDDLGVIIDANDQRNLTDSFKSSDIFDSKDLKNKIQNNQIIINDGISDLSKKNSLESVNLESSLYDEIGKSDEAQLRDGFIEIIRENNKIKTIIKWNDETKQNKIYEIIIQRTNGNATTIVDKYYDVYGSLQTTVSHIFTRDIYGKVISYQEAVL